jgi:cell fate regulator YaaT (PSP1 superfamily)
MNNSDNGQAQPPAAPLAPQGPPAVPPQATQSDFTMRIVGIRFRSVGRVHDFDARDFKFSRGDRVICDLEDKGTMLGYVSKPTIAIEPGVLKLKLRPILRPANHNDLKTREKHESQEKEAMNYIRSTVADRRIPMHVIAVEIPLNAKKALVYFSSDDRVDFRELIKDLVRYFKMRVELRQLGARDETKFVGGIGPCGQETCCSKFLKSFHPVSIKMAKDQGLSLNPTKVSGNCGRLKCCLAYEQPVYAEARKTLPKLGNCVKCSSGGDGKGSGCGIVAKLDVLGQKVTVKFDDGTYDTVPVGRILEQDTFIRKPEPMKVVRVADPEPQESVEEATEDVASDDLVTRVIVADEDPTTG